MNRKCDDGYRLLGAEAVLKRLRAMQKHARDARRGDEKAVHDMRVASRRVRLALALCQGCFAGRSRRRWRRSVRKLTRALGRARDVDVQSEAVERFLSGVTPAFRPGVERLLLRLRQRRARLQRKVERALDRFKANGVAREMRRSLDELRARLKGADLRSPVALECARSAIARYLDEMLSYEQAILRPECVAELHAMRIAAKRLRYALEVFEPLYAAELQDALELARKIQTDLGAIHDCDVWQQCLPEFLERERRRTENYFGAAGPLDIVTLGIERFRADRRRLRERLYADFLRFWRQTRQQKVWDRLREAIAPG